jgi:TATA-box binding protein (TBP) (component of TFIID and TFIIIB)
MELDDEWLYFQNSLNNNIDIDNIYQKPKLETVENAEIPKCSDIYISTQTKIVFLNSPVDIYKIYWEIPTIDYHIPRYGIIKKSIKINCINHEQVEILEEKIKKEKNISVTILSQVDNPNARKTKFKDVRKIDIGLCKKDLTSYRKKKKGAFYNCFAVILRVFYKNEYKEVHAKIFNTGKLEIPGIQNNDLLTITLDKLITILKPHINEELDYHKDSISTVLINSNFNCGFYIDRFKLYEILKDKYYINSAYDPCSYPGIQCKFYYHPKAEVNNGIKTDLFTEGWTVVSFMIFRTGSVLIVGNCNEDVLRKIYKYLKEMLKTEYLNIFIKNNTTKKQKAIKKIRKRTILLDLK